MHITGLTLDEVRDRTKRGFVNKSKTATSKKISHILRDNIINLFNILITPMIIILLQLGLYKEVISVGGITLANTIIGIIQELKAKMTLDKISLIDVKKCTVIRDGKDYLIPVESIVQGDFVKLRSGEPVLSDGTVVDANHLEIDESLLTGESDYIFKQTGTQVLSGSFCISGTGVYTADKVGDESYVNDLTKQAKQYKKFLSPIQHKVNDIIKFLITFAIILTILYLMDYTLAKKLHPEQIKEIPHSISVETFEKNILKQLLEKNDKLFIKSIYLYDRDDGSYKMKDNVADDELGRLSALLNKAKDTAKFADTVRGASAIIMTLVPQGLVLSITLIFIVGIVRMSSEGALIQKPNAIESMAHVNVMCMDKTGTLTQNRLRLREIIPLGISMDEATRFARLFAANSLEKNKTVEAIVSALGEELTETLDTVPFSSQNKYSAVRARIGGKIYDMVLGASSSIKAMTDYQDFDSLERKITKISAEGYRVVAFALREADIKIPLRSSLNNLQIIGLIVFEDEIKPEAQEIIDYFQGRNIDLKIISGDHPETVKSIAQVLKVKNSDRAVTGDELESMLPEEFENAVMHNTIFARVSPQQKLEIVRSLQKNGRYVAMVGDGVNDALAIKEANLGISMGSGARVTKDVSEITLIHDTFEIMPGILTQGQIIIQNVSDMAKLFLFKNSYSVILIFISQYLDMIFPFNPQHVTLFNFITITIPSTYIILFAKKGSFMSKDYMKEILRYSITAGLITAIMALAIGLYSLVFAHADEKLYRTCILGVICTLGVFNFMYIYLWPRRVFDLLDIKSILIALISLSFLPAAIYLFNIVNDFFTLARLGARDWAIISLFSIAGIIATYVICKYDLFFKMFTPSEQRQD